MRTIPLPKPVLESIKTIPEGVMCRTIRQFEPTGKEGFLKTFPQGYSLSKDLLLDYSDSHLQTLMRLLFTKTSPEYCYRDYLYHTYPTAEMEVHLECGIVDIMTSSHCIEVKKAKTWKHSLGQVLSYAFCSGKLPAVALIGKIPPIAHAILSHYQIDIIALP